MDRTNAERQRRYIARLKAGVSNDTAKLKAQLAQAKQRIATLEQELAQLRREQPKVAPPDEERIKALTTENEDLRRKLGEMRAWGGVMSFATQSKIAKVLHPDSRKHATEADKDEALRLFTAWKAVKDKARRKAR